jgi:hypothetical protein
MYPVRERGQVEPAPLFRGDLESQGLQSAGRNAFRLDDCHYEAEGAGVAESVADAWLVTTQGARTTVRITRIHALTAATVASGREAACY